MFLSVDILGLDGELTIKVDRVGDFDSGLPGICWSEPIDLYACYSLPFSVYFLHWDENHLGLAVCMCDIESCLLHRIWSVFGENFIDKVILALHVTDLYSVGPICRLLILKGYLSTLDIHVTQNGGFITYSLIWIGL